VKFHKPSPCSHTSSSWPGTPNSEPHKKEIIALRDAEEREDLFEIGNEWLLPGWDLLSPDFGGMKPNVQSIVDCTQLLRSLPNSKPHRKENHRTEVTVLTEECFGRQLMIRCWLLDLLNSRGASERAGSIHHFLQIKVAATSGSARRIWPIRAHRASRSSFVIHRIELS
jgi:hypothetical protein